MKVLIIPIVIILFASVVTINDSFAQEVIKKSKVSGTHDMKLYGKPQVDYRVDANTPIVFTVKSKVKIGDQTTEFLGGGYLKPDKYSYDRQCKSVKGYEYLISMDKDFVRLDFIGKICYIGGNLKAVNFVFTGSNAKGIFENAKFSGSLTGSSDKYETRFNLVINSLLSQYGEELN